MPPSPLLKQTLMHNHNASNTTTFDAILTSLMAPLQISGPPEQSVPQAARTEEYDPLISWLLSSSSSSSSTPNPFDPVPCDSTPHACNDIYGELEYDPRNPRLSPLSLSRSLSLSLSPAPSNKAQYSSSTHPSESLLEYDPSNPKLSLPMAMLMSRGRERGFRCPASRISPPPSPLAPPPPTNLAPPSPPITPPRSYALPSSSPSLSPPPPSHLLPSSSSPSSLLGLSSSRSSGVESRERPRSWAGDRRRLDAMKRRRIEERREVRGRDPVTGVKIERVEKGGKGKGVGKGMGKKMGAKKVVGGRVAKVGRK